MAMIGMTEGVHKLALLGVGGSGTYAITLRLTGANYVMLYSDTWASQATEETELSYSGYAAVALTAASWTPTDNSPSNGVTSQAYPPVTFTFNSGGAGTTVVYGYFMTIAISATNYILGGENISPTYTIPAGGGSLIITPTLQFGFASGFVL